MALGDKTWHYWVPGVAQATLLHDIFTNGLSGHVGRFMSGMFSPDGSNGLNNNLAIQAQTLSESARDQFLADREHQEMREDTAYQRGVADMEKAGLNPYTIGANPAPSSASSVGGDTLTNKLQVLGFMLDLKNLDAKNRQITNNLITGLLKAK